MADRPKTAEEFDARFDAGEDMGEFMEWEHPRRHSIDIETEIASAVGTSLLRRIDQAAAKLGTSRSELVSRWLTERLDAAA